jgi:ABC-type phosphate transport system auxiliary subunit
MLTQLDRFVVNARLLELAEELSAGCDPDFDTHQDDLEREFQELRYQLHNIE